MNLVERNYLLACDPDAGGCGKLNCIHHFLSTPPDVFTIGITFLHFLVLWVDQVTCVVIYFLLFLVMRGVPLSLNFHEL